MTAGRQEPQVEIDRQITVFVGPMPDEQFRALFTRVSHAAHQLHERVVVAHSPARPLPEPAERTTA